MKHESEVSLRNLKIPPHVASNLVCNTPVKRGRRRAKLQFGRCKHEARDRISTLRDELRRGGRRTRIRNRQLRRQETQQEVR